MKNIIFISLIFGTLFSCKPEGRVYESHKELSPMVEWLKKDTIQFEVDIQDNESFYDLSLALRYATGYQYPKLLVSIEMISPSGVKENFPAEMTIVSEDGKYKGEPGFDIWDYEEKVFENFKVSEKGKYVFKITQNMPEDPLNFAMELGLILDKVN